MQTQIPKSALPPLALKIAIHHHTSNSTVEVIIEYLNQISAKRTANIAIFVKKPTLCFLFPPAAVPTISLLAKFKPICASWEELPYPNHRLARNRISLQWAYPTPAWRVLLPDEVRCVLVCW